VCQSIAASMVAPLMAWLWVGATIMAAATIVWSVSRRWTLSSWPAVAATGIASLAGLLALGGLFVLWPQVAALDLRLRMLIEMAVGTGLFATQVAHVVASVVLFAFRTSLRSTGVMVVSCVVFALVLVAFLSVPPASIIG
jgi:hypothetical protein